MPKKSPKTTKTVAKKTVKSKPAVKKITKTKTVSVKKAVKRKASAKQSTKMKTVAVKKTNTVNDQVRSLKIWLFFVGFLLLLGLALSNLYWSQGSCKESCSFLPTILQKKVIDEPVVDNPVGLANPASMNCLDMNGNLEMKERGDGGQYGVCVFPNGNVCEEWALFRNECPGEGLVPGDYRTILEYYCGVTGGEVNTENKECIFSDETSCDLEDYYNGICHK